MALADIPVGKQLTPTPWDYTQHIDKDGTRGLTALLHKVKPQDMRYMFPGYDGDAHYRMRVKGADGKIKGILEGVVLKDGPTPKLHVGYIKTVPEVQGNGLGTDMYEALMGHAYNVEGARHISGDIHSTPTHAIHSKLSARHGMKYQAQPFDDGTNAPTGGFDNKWGPYSYALKSELAKLEKSAEDLQQGAPSAQVMIMLGLGEMERNCRAASFLAGIPTSHKCYRKALQEADGDHEKAALLAHDIEPTETNLKALRGYLGVESLHKGEVLDGEVKMPKEVKALTPAGQETADGIMRAFKDHYVVFVKMGGKHSAGSMLGRDPQTTKVYLIKSGSGGQSPAAGVKEIAASQNKREGAFSAVADLLGLGDYVPHADTIYIDGVEYAAIELLPWSYKSLLEQEKAQGGFSRWVLAPYLRDGRLHQWAVLDYICGQTDRHAQNILATTEGRVGLIDAGAAFAGRDFNPSHDKNSFIPYYLRAWSDGFNRLTPQERLRAMPHTDEGSRNYLSSWVNQIDENRLRHILESHGVDAEPTLERLAHLRELAAMNGVDRAINSMWLGLE